MGEEKSIKLKPSDYQPSKAELEETHKPDVLGDTLKGKMDAMANAVMQPAKIEHEE